MVKYGRLCLIMLLENKGHVGHTTPGCARRHTCHPHLAQQIFPPDSQTPEVTAKYNPGTTCSMLQAGLFQLLDALDNFLHFSGHKFYFLIIVEIPLPKRVKLFTCLFFCFFFSLGKFHISPITSNPNILEFHRCGAKFSSSRAVPFGVHVFNS